MGHTEAIQITFDPKVVSYEKILHIYFTMHNATASVTLVEQNVLLNCLGFDSYALLWSGHRQDM